MTSVAAPLQEQYIWLIPNMVRTTGIHTIVAPGTDVGTASRFIPKLRAELAHIAPGAKASIIEMPAYDFCSEAINAIRLLNKIIGWPIFVVHEEGISNTKLRVALDSSNVVIFAAPDSASYWVVKCEGGLRGKTGRLSQRVTDA